MPWLWPFCMSFFAEHWAIILSDKVCKEMILMWSNSVFHTRAHYPTVRIYVFTWSKMDLYDNLGPRQLRDSRNQCAKNDFNENALNYFTLHTKNKPLVIVMESQWLDNEYHKEKTYIILYATEVEIFVLAQKKCVFHAPIMDSCNCLVSRSHCNISIVSKSSRCCNLFVNIFACMRNGRMKCMWIFCQ